MTAIITRIIYITFFICIFSITSCKNEVVKTIEGDWSIDTIYYKYYDVKTCLYLNILDFKEEGKAELPYTGERCNDIITKSNDESGNWKIIKSKIPNDTIPLRMKIITNNELFEGTHKIVFYKDVPNKLLKMEIWSDSLYIVCRKGFYSFDDNIETINRLEKISWTTRPK